MQSFLTNMICCLVIRLTFILFLALIMASISDTEAAALPQPDSTPVRRVVVLPNALLCQSDVSKYKERKKLDEYICISPVFNSWVSSLRNYSSGWLLGQHGCRKYPVSLARPALEIFYIKFTLAKTYRSKINKPSADHHSLFPSSTKP